MPLSIAALFVVGHDAAHHTLTSSRWLNRILGRLCLLPSYHPYTSWCHAHNTLHHGGTCLKGKHPDFAPLGKHEFDSLPAWRQSLERIYRAPLGVGLCYVDGFLSSVHAVSQGTEPFTTRKSVSSRSYARAGVCRISILDRPRVDCLHTESAAVTLAVHGRHVMLPWGIWIYFTGVMSFVQHTHPRTAWYDDPAEWEFFSAQLGARHM